MPTTRENMLDIGDVFRWRNKSHGFMTCIVIDKKDTLLTVHRPFCYGKEKNYEVGLEKFSFWASESIEVDILEKR